MNANNVKRSALWAMLAVVAAVIGMAFLILGAEAQSGSRPPSNVRAENSAVPGEVILRWDSSGAPFHRVGWVNMETFYGLPDQSRWLEIFSFRDNESEGILGQEQRIANLKPGVQYAFIVASVSGRFAPGIPGWSEWEYLDLSGSASCPADNAAPAPPGGSGGGASPTPTPTPSGGGGDQPSATQEPSGTRTPGDYDTDDDGFIEVSTANQLQAIRHDPTGAGVATASKYVLAFPNKADRMGCPPPSCVGYELANDIDWPRNLNWVPIGRKPDTAYAGDFNGNGHTIRNLRVDKANLDYVGLFGALGVDTTVENVVLEGVNLFGKNYVGGIAGHSMGRMNTVRVSGSVVGGSHVGGVAGVSAGDIATARSDARVTSTSHYAGGLVGLSRANITGGIATGDVTARGGDNVGGLVGYQDLTASGSVRRIFASYATGDVTANRTGQDHVGGLVGYLRGNIAASYATGDVSGKRIAGGLVGRYHSGQVSDTYATGNVSAQWYAGGHTGLVSGSGVRNSYSLGRVSADGYLGGFAGSFAAAMVNCYWDVNTSRISASGRSGDAIGVGTDELQSLDDSADWNADWWDFGEDNEYPVLQAGDLDTDAQRR